MKLLHYGLQRSGTNFLETLLKKNYRVRFGNSNRDRSSPLQKHCRFYADKSKIPEPKYNNNIAVSSIEQFESLFDFVPDHYLVISKDPYSWYLSYRNWAEKCQWPTPGYHYIEEYNLFYGFFKDLCAQSDKFLFIRYIDLISNADAELDRIERAVGLRRKFFTRAKRKIPTDVSQSGHFTQNKQDYYKNRRYLEKYTREELQALNSLLDEDVVTYLGYERHDLSA